ncbi:TlpA disulfide reductase family protein [Algoriphagus aquimarinus]|uniref:TlpA family protein disulfide reductase n=1 Tax=Algoriphagus aquimarinus TaxID=237018 RepID=UPI0030D90D51|tara:strand:- start:2214 stop:2741 length:528 start_codon:yes stop_codon:yes gene_type:complete
MKINSKSCLIIFSILLSCCYSSLAQNLELRNQPSPTFELLSYSGVEFKLEDAKDKVIVLDFWSTWCAPCIKAFPAMIEVEKSFSSDNDVIFLYVNSLEVKGKTSDNVFDFLQKRGLDINFYKDNNDVVSEAFGVTGLPVKIVIDKSGIVRYMDSGFVGDNQKLITKLTNEIERLK